MIKRKKEFYPKRLHYLIVYIIQELKDVWRLELVKLIYLIDWTYYCEFGRPLTEAYYIREKWGPLIADIDGQINKMKGREVKLQRAYRGGIHHLIGSRPRFEPQFNSCELNVIHKILRTYGNLNNEALKDISYRTSPMQDILNEEQEVGKWLFGKPIDFKKYPSRDPLRKYKKLLSTLDFSEKGTKKERMRAHFEIYESTELMRKRSNTVLLSKK